MTHKVPSRSTLIHRQARCTTTRLTREKDYAVTFPKQDKLCFVLRSLYARFLPYHLHICDGLSHDLEHGLLSIDQKIGMCHVFAT